MEEELLVTTCPSRWESERAMAALDEGGIGYKCIGPTPPLARVAAPALIINYETVSQLRETAVRDVVFSGWVEYRPSKADMPLGPEPEAGACFHSAAIMVLQRCVADQTKIRLVAHLEGDLSPVLPYLNAVMKQASYTPANQTLTYMDKYRMIVLYPKRVTIAKADEIVDAWLTLEQIRRVIEDTWANREQLEPCYETRKKPPILEIYKRFPGTNCGLCGEKTCMAFAAQLWSGQVSLRRCTPIFAPTGEPYRQALMEIVAGMGIDDAEG